MTVQACQLYLTVLQILCGCVAPQLVRACSHAAHALRFAQQHGMDINAARGRLGWERVMHSRVCSVAYMPIRLLVLLPLTAGLLILLSQTLYG